MSDHYAEDVEILAAELFDVLTQAWEDGIGYSISMSRLPHQKGQYNVNYTVFETPKTQD